MVTSGQRVLEEAEESRPYIRRILTRSLCNHHDVEDGIQEVFLRAFTRASQYDPTRPLKRWMSLIAVNYCRDRARQRKTFLYSHSEDTDYDLPYQPQDPLARMVDEENMGEIKEAMGNLSEPRQRILRLLLEEKPYHVIADEMGIPLGTVQSSIHGAKKTIRTRVGNTTFLTE